MINAIMARLVSHLIVPSIKEAPAETSALFVPSEMKISAWVTRECLTKGIRKRHGYLSPHSKDTFVAEDGKLDIYFGHGIEWHLSAHEAVLRANKILATELSATRKWLSDLEAITFHLPDELPYDDFPLLYEAVRAIERSQALVGEGDDSMAKDKMDPMRGLNPDQSGPKDKIQNGDPRSSPSRDQRSGAREAGGPGPSKQPPFEETNSVKPSLVEGNTTTPVPSTGVAAAMPEGVTGETLPSDAYDRSGQGSIGSVKTTAMDRGGSSLSHVEKTEGGGTRVVVESKEKGKVPEGEHAPKDD